MKKIIAAIALAVLATASLSAPSFARKGADDPAGHNANDDRGGTRSGASTDSARTSTSTTADDKGGQRPGGKGRGADDKQPDDRVGR